MMLHREEYYHKQDPDWAEQNPDKVGIAELILAKQRNGPTGTVEMTWDGNSTSFRTISHAVPPSSAGRPRPAMPARAPVGRPGDDDDIPI
jgi:replicative DNA helicase